MFRAIFLIVLTLLPIVYFLLFRDITTFAVFSLVIGFSVLFFLLYSWFTAKKAKEYSDFSKLITDILFDFASIILSNNIAWAWGFKSKEFITLNNIEYYTVLIFYIIISTITVIELFMTLKNYNSGNWIVKYKKWLNKKGHLGVLFTF